MTRLSVKMTWCRNAEDDRPEEEWRSDMKPRPRHAQRGDASEDDAEGTKSRHPLLHDSRETPRKTEIPESLESLALEFLSPEKP